MWSFRWSDQTPSFYDFLTLHHPDFLRLPQGAIPQLSAETRQNGLAEFGTAPIAFSKGTTVLALRYQDGAVVAGDRLATEGFQVSARRIEKVYRADEFSVIAIAGAAGPCIELARLFQTELEHYEKLEGAKLSTEGKANKLSQMVRGNFSLAIQGLIVIPIFISYDTRRQEGRIFKYDVTGGRYEETEFYATGSGGKDARNTMKKFYRSGLSEREAVDLALEALYDAADEDRATAGPDLIRGIFPTVKTVTRRGVEDVEDRMVKEFYESLTARKRSE